MAARAPRAKSRLRLALRSLIPTARIPADRGSTTVEIAVALPALVLVLVIAVWGVKAAGDQVACVDAVRAGARAAARGEDLTAVRNAGAKAAPPGARIDISRGPDTTDVTIDLAVRPPTGTPLPALILHEHAEALSEPGVVTGS